MREEKRNTRSWPSDGGCLSAKAKKGTPFLQKARVLFRKGTHALGKWLRGFFSNKCPECGAPMTTVRHQTGTKGEWFPVLHCTGCHHEYILK